MEDNTLPEIGQRHAWARIIPDQFVSKPHWYNGLEFIYVKQGTIKMRMEESDPIVKEGELFVVSRGCTHSFIGVSDHYCLYVINVSQCFLDTFSQLNGAVLADFYENNFLVGKDETVRKCVKDMIECSYDQLKEWYIISKVMELSVYLFHYKKLIVETIKDKSYKDSMEFEKFVQYVEVNMNHSITLKGMAEHLGFSEAYCSRYVKKKTGMTFSAYVNAVRIEAAQGLLCSTSQPVTEIAYACGFNSIQTFNRVFKSMCNMSPKKYRSQYGSLHGQDAAQEQQEQQE